MDDLSARMLGVKGVTAVHDLHVWTVTSGMVAMSGHAVVPTLEDHPRALAELQRVVVAAGVAHATIQLEAGDACPEPGRDPHPGPGHHHGHRH